MKNLMHLMQMHFFYLENFKKIIQKMESDISSLNKDDGNKDGDNENAPELPSIKDNIEEIILDEYVI